ncbi:MAG TPA: hypothetical protein VNO52_18775, partial [Methylomirabilota bacterium]|nr:hypothetical protein [Methylomirabilota bacterium]
DPWDPDLIRYINLRLALLGCPVCESVAGAALPDIAAPLLAIYRERSRLLANYLCPADWRIQNFLDEYLYDTGLSVELPRQTLVLDQPGLARTLSLPPGRDEFASAILKSYRVRQGVLHNPVSDRRTTQGVFHVAEGGLPVPDDKRAVPRAVYARLLQLAFRPPVELLRLPFTAGQANEAACFVSLLLRPLVCPAVPGFTEEKSMEIRFFAPGNLVSNLDFVESIFGNGGDPRLPENDAGLDVAHWTGHTGCVVLAPHLTTVTKRAAGLPHWDQATERQRRDGMCWKTEDELYNDGAAFKLTARDTRGVMVTIIADNYYGYCKKEVKTQISYSANLFGLCEEEHAGGALVYPSYDLALEFSGEQHVQHRGHSFEEALRLCGAVMELQPEGHAIDRNYPDIVYVPEFATFDLRAQRIEWTQDGAPRRIKLLADKIYVRPSGYMVRMEKPAPHRPWRLVGTRPEPTLCHKPCTVSGGGKSEISKSLADAILTGPVFVANFKKDFDQIARMLRRDYSKRFKDPALHGSDQRPILSRERSVGSVIKLLTPSADEYSPEYNEWLNSIPQYLKELLFVVKRFYKPEWGERWREHFSVDVINGLPGNELKCDDQKLVTTSLRVGYDADGSWRVFGLRKDFHPAVKIQVEDDITASVVVPAERVKNRAEGEAPPALKFVQNCEARLFQRPDDAIHRGYDRQAESDLAQPGNFLSNFEPLTARDARELIEDAVGFAQYTEPMQRLIRAAALQPGPTYFVSSAHPRLIEGRPSKNPRYLQPRPDLLAPRETYLLRMATRLHRRIPLDEPVAFPVNAVVPGRRNNPPDAAAGVRALAVFNPIHYLELPELFLEYVCSLTGKSPSTTGAGSEGALTKGPFNALPGIIDLNNAFLAAVLTQANAFISAAGYVGPRVRVDHDISLLIPEVWARMKPEERQPAFLIAAGHLERCRDFEHRGRPVLASRLGYRITASFVRAFFGRIFNHPHLVFTDEMLRPELQDPDAFADGMDNIVSTGRQIAESYFADGTIELACPPLRALLHVMRDGHYEGRGLDDPGFRALFTLEHVLKSDWYQARLVAKQANDINLWKRHVAYLESFLAKPNYADEAERLGVKDRLAQARACLKDVSSPDYLVRLRGTLGSQPLAATAGPHRGTNPGV